MRDRHLVELEKSVEEARTRAAVQHEEIVKLGASSDFLPAARSCKGQCPFGEEQCFFWLFRSPPPSGRLTAVRLTRCAVFFAYVDSVTYNSCGKR